jgi:hypothetical protein
MNLKQARKLGKLKQFAQQHENKDPHPWAKSASTRSSMAAVDRKDIAPENESAPSRRRTGALGCMHAGLISILPNGRQSKPLREPPDSRPTTQQPIQC